MSSLAESDDLSPPSEGTPWLRLSSHLRTRRPSPHVLLISISNRPPLNALSADVLSELKRVLLALDARATRAIVLTVDPAGAHRGGRATPTLGLGPLDGAGGPAPPQLALSAESALASLGFRGLLRRLPSTAHLSALNLLCDVCALLRALPQVTIAALRGESRAEGCELVLCCDLRVFEARGTTLCPGAEPSRGTVRAMRRLVGAGRSLEVLLLPGEEGSHEDGLDKDEDEGEGEGEDKDEDEQRAPPRGVVLSAERAHALGLATALVDVDAARTKQAGGKSRKTTATATATATARGYDGQDDPLLNAAVRLARRVLDAGGKGKASTDRVAGIKAVLLEEGE